MLQNVIEDELNFLCCVFQVCMYLALGLDQEVLGSDQEALDQELDTFQVTASNDCLDSLDKNNPEHSHNKQSLFVFSRGITVKLYYCRPEVLLIRNTNIKKHLNVNLKVNILYIICRNA